MRHADDTTLTADTNKITTKLTEGGDWKREVRTKHQKQENRMHGC